MVSIRQIPGYAEAVAAEADQRQEAWLALEPDICGIPVVPLTLRKIMFLSLSKNDFVSSHNDTISEYSVAEFLWVVSTQFTPANARARKRFYKSIKRVSIKQAVKEISQYLERSFFDAPIGSTATNHTAPKVDWITNCIHRYATHYSFHPDTTLDLPFRQISQLSRCQKGDDPEASKTLANPSDAIAAKHLESLNAKGRAKPPGTPTS
jgi:hypothetical protein